MLGWDIPPQPPVWGATDCLGTGVWERIGLGVTRDMFNKGVMIYGVFHGPGHCSHRWTRELRLSHFEGGKPEGMSDSGQGPAHRSDPGWNK